MWYIGGKARQSKAIVKNSESFQFSTYVEPFCGALWSASAVIKRFPDKKFILNDSNPFLVRMWQDARDGWDPPQFVSEETYAWYNRHRPPDDPMTAYVGFAWSFGGMFFQRPAKDYRRIKRGKDPLCGSWVSTVRKIDLIRKADVRFSCLDYRAVKVSSRSLVYMDPPYEGRTPQVKNSTPFDYSAYHTHCEALAVRPNVVVIATEFLNPRKWPVLHDWGDTVVRHRNGRGTDGTVELLMRVRA